MLTLRLLVIALFCLACWPASADAARRLSLAVDRVDIEGGSLQSVGLTLEGDDNAADPMSLAVTVARLNVPAADLQWSSLAWRCDELKTLEPLVCEGPLQLAGKPAGRLAVDVSSARTGLSWTQGRRSASVTKDVASPWGVEVKNLPVAWFSDFLKQVWADGRFSEGSLSAKLRVDAASEALRVEGHVRLDGLAFDTPAGDLAGAGLRLPLALRYEERATAQSISVRGRIDAGELLVSPIYVAVPASGIDVAIVAASKDDGRWRLSEWRWEDGEVLRADGEAELAADGALLALTARSKSADLGGLRTRYLDGVLAPAGFSGLQLGGRGAGVVAFDEEGLSSLEVEVSDTFAVDPRGRFTLGGLSGDLRWSRDAAVADSRISWAAAALYGVGIDSGSLAFQSREGQLSLSEPMRTGMLGGELALDRFVWRPPRGQRPLRIELGVGVKALNLGSLSQRLGWPAFEGSIGGSLPNAIYENNQVRFDGALTMALFGGEVRIDSLALERPFGVAPSLAANVRFSDIDLAPLTRAFGFGEITGRLDGRLRDLRLVDWTPVAFDARLLTDREWDGRRRISQRAVQDISDLGGSGLVAGLQARVLRIFDDFGYDRIGIGCVLKDNRCAMTGLKKRGAGYVIIEGRGLPRIEVIGFRRSVDWPTLVQRLRDATEGDTLRID